MRELRIRNYGCGLYRKQEFIRPMGDLLEDQRKGRFLTPGEKKRIQEYAQEQRKKKQSQKKKRK